MKKHDWVLIVEDGGREIHWCRRTGHLKIRVFNKYDSKWVGKIYKPKITKATVA